MTMKSAFVLAALLAAAPACSQDSSGGGLGCTQWGCVGGSATGSVSSWRSSSEGDYQNNDGASLTLDAAAPIPFLAEYGLGVQGSLSDGVYDLGGRDSNKNTNPQGQQFVSFGIFRRPDVDGAWWSRWGAGLVYDTSYNEDFGTQVNNIMIRQLRGKASYDIAGGHEAGVWFTDYSGTAHSSNNEYTAGVENSYRAVDQLNFFYKYNMERGGSLSAYFGPGVGGQSIELDSASGKPNHSRVFTYTFGANATVPFCDYASFTGGFSYARPNDMLNGALASANLFDAFSLSMGMRVYFGGNARVREDSGRRWMPYVTAPDNASFITQSNTAN
jgi:hypothetical protein